MLVDAGYGVDMKFRDGLSELGLEYVVGVPANTKLKDLIKLAKHRWIIERDDEELQQELGLGHYEGRGWRGFHRHTTLCTAAYGFLVAERSRFPPQPEPAISGYRSPKFQRASRHGAHHVRPERHNPHSIVTLRITIACYLLRKLPGCPFCGVLIYDTVVLTSC